MDVIVRQTCDLNVGQIHAQIDGLIHA